MTKPSNILVSTILRNQRLRGPTSSAQQNDFQAEVIRDLTSIQDQWNSLIVPLGQLLPDGTLDSTVDAFTYGLDGRHLWVNSDATAALAAGRFFSITLNRPFTAYEQFLEVYNELDANVESLTNLISEGSNSSGLTTDEQNAIGANIFNNSLTSAPDSIDGRSQSNQNHIVQLAKDMYGPGFYSFSGDGTEILNNSVRAMVDALLELHSGDWDDDITLSHSFSADDITSGTMNQDYVGPTSASGTGVNDAYGGSPTNLAEDLNQIRTLVRNLKDAASGFSAALSLNANWSPVSAQPTDVKLLTDLKGSAARSDNNPWGYDYTDVDGLDTRLQASADYAGRPSLTDDTPSYSNTLGFSNGDDLTTAVGGLAGYVSTIDSGTSGLATTVSGHINNTSNPHSTTLTLAAAAGGSAPASQVSLVDAGGYYTATDAEDAFQEVHAYTTSVSGYLEGYIDSEITTLSGVLDADITTVDSRLTTVSGTLQTQIDSNESAINALAVNAGFRRYEFDITSLPDDSAITISHSGGMFPQVQVITYTTIAGYNANSVLPIHQTAPSDQPGVLIEHSGVDHFILTNKLDATLTSGLVVALW